MVVRELVARLGFNVNQSGLNKFDKQLGLMKNKLKGMNQNINQMADGLANFGKKATLFLSVPIIALGAAAVKTASDFEQLDVAFTTMLGSSEKANVFIADMTAFAARTPFTIKGVFQSSKQLLAMGIEADKIKPTLKALGDVSAGLSVPIGRLAFNFGQVRAAGKLTGRELRDFVTAGVPLLDTLANMLGKTSIEIKDMISAGEISFDLVEKAFVSMASSGGKFENLMEKQMKTIGGLFSNFLDNIIITAKEFGDMIIESLKLKEVLKALTKWLGKLLKVIKELQPHQKKLIVGFALFLTLIGPLVLSLAVIIKLFAFVASALLIIKTAFFAASGGAIAFNASVLLIPFLILAAVAALALFVDDVWTWVKGGDSLVGKLIGPWTTFRDVIISVFDNIKTKIKVYFKGIKSGLDRTKRDLKPIFDWFKTEWALWVEFMSMEIELPLWIRKLIEIISFFTKSAGTKLITGSVNTPFSGSGMAGLGSNARKIAGLSSMTVYNQNKIEVVQGDGQDSVATAKKISDELNKRINENLEQKFRMVGNSNLIYE